MIVVWKQTFQEERYAIRMSQSSARGAAGRTALNRGRPSDSGRRPSIDVLSKFAQIADLSDGTHWKIPFWVAEVPSLDFANSLRRVARGIDGVLGFEFHRESRVGAVLVEARVSYENVSVVISFVKRSIADDAASLGLARFVDLPIEDPLARFELDGVDVASLITAERRSEARARGLALLDFQSDLFENMFELHMEDSPSPISNGTVPESSGDFVAAAGEASLQGEAWPARRQDLVEAAVGDIALRAAQFEDAKAALQASVENARVVGVTWARIGAIFEVTPQAVMQRFNPKAREARTKRRRERD